MDHLYFRKQAFEIKKNPLLNYHVNYHLTLYCFKSCLKRTVNTLIPQWLYLYLFFFTCLSFNFSNYPLPSSPHLAGQPIIRLFQSKSRFFCINWLVEFFIYPNPILHDPIIYATLWCPTLSILSQPIMTKIKRPLPPPIIITK